MTPINKTQLNSHLQNLKLLSEEEWLADQLFQTEQKPDTKHNDTPALSVYCNGTQSILVLGDGKYQSARRLRLVTQAPKFLKLALQLIVPLKKIWANQTEGDDLWPLFEELRKTINEVFVPYQESEKP
jgi:hypothetical protein